MQPPVRSRWPQWILAGVASGIVMLSFVIPLGRAFLSKTTKGSDRRSSVEGSLGSPSLGFSIERGGKTMRGASGDVVLPGDRIRFSYSSDRDAQFALLHVTRDQAGVYFPSAARTVALPAGRDTALDLAIELDNRAGEERVFGLFCAAPLELEPVRLALQKDDGPPDLPGCQVAALTLHKKLL
jgi:hypothetical protein